MVPPLWSAGLSGGREFMSAAIHGFTRGETLLSVEGVSLTLGDNLILRDINVSVKNLGRHTDDGKDNNTGQIIAFLGPSGIGKTQFLRILAGLQKPSVGEVFLGQHASKVKPGSVGMVSQRYYLFRHRTVMSNLMVAAKQNGKHDDATCKQKCLEILELFDLLDKQNLYPLQLSGGQQQRVAIAQQLLCSEHFLLMDEPTAGLDVKNKNRVARLVQKVANQHDLNTIIIVTHDIPSALAIADTVWIMGRDRDEAGQQILGARIIEQLDLVEMGLTWHPDVRKEPGFADLVREIEDKFESL